MDTIISYLNSAGKSFVDFALPMLIQSGVLIIILLGLDFALRRKVKAVFRYAIWMLVLLKLLLPASLCAPTGIGYWLGDKLPPVAAQPPSLFVPPSITPADRPTLPETAALEPSLSQMPSAPPPDETITPPVTTLTAVTWHAVALLAWFAIVITLVLLLIQRWLFVKGLIAQSTQPDGKMLELLEQCRRQIEITSRIDLRLSPNATSPSVCGLFRPVILMPNSLSTQLSRRQLQAVLLHELAHIKHADLWVSFVQTILQIAYFYNPLLWLANITIRRVREQAVDEMVLVAMGAHAEDYPNTLLNVSRLTFRRPALSLRLIGVVESKKALAQRIKHIVTRPFPKTAKLGLLSAITIIITAAILLPMAAAKEGRVNFQEIEDSKEVLVEELKVGEVLKEMRQAYQAAQKETKHIHIMARQRVDEWDETKQQWIEQPVQIDTWSWHEREGKERFRVDFDPEILKWDDGPLPYCETRYLVLFDGKEYIKVDEVENPDTNLYRAQVSGRKKKLSGLGEDKDRPKGVADSALRAASRSGTDFLPDKERGPFPAFLGDAHFLASLVRRQSDWVARKIKSQDKVLVELRKHWKVPDGSNEFEEVIWLEPERGYSVASWTLSKRGKIYSALKVNAWKKLSDSLWFPSDICQSRTTKEPRIRYKAEQVGFYDEADAEAIYGMTDLDMKARYVKLPHGPKEPGIKEGKERHKVEEKEEKSFTATLTNGVTVELVGICKHPSEGKQWWQPDGSILETPPYASIGARVYDGQPRELAIRLANIPDEKISYRWFLIPSRSTGGGSHPKDQNGKHIEDLWAIAAGMDKSAATATVRFGVSAGKWQTKATFNAKGNLHMAQEGHEFHFAKPYVEDNHTYVTVSDNMLDFPHRLIALDKGGIIHESVDTGSGTTGEIRQSTFGFKNLPLKNLQEFQFQTRPYEWVTFKNVALQPGHKTDVQIDVEKPVEQSMNKPEPQKSVAMLDVLKGIYAAAHNAVMEQNDTTTAVAAMDLLMPQLDDFEANLKGTEAEKPVALVIKQVKLIYKAIKEGNLNRAKVLMEGLDAVGQQIEDKIREAGKLQNAKIQTAIVADSPPIVLDLDTGEVLQLDKEFKNVSLQPGHKTDVQIRTGDSVSGRSALHEAAENGHPKIVGRLIQNGANVNSKAHLDYTPLHLAAQNGHPETSAVLIARGADINALSVLGETPLHLAAKNGHSQTVLTLIDKGADINVRMKSGKTPLRLAIENGHSQTADILVAAAARRKIQRVWLRADFDSDEPPPDSADVFDLATGKTNQIRINRKGLTEKEINDRLMMEFMNAKHGDLFLAEYSPDRKGQRLYIIRSGRHVELEIADIEEAGKIDMNTLLSHLRAEDARDTGWFEFPAFRQDHLDNNKTGVILTGDGTVAVIQFGSYQSENKKREMKYIILGEVDMANLPEPKLAPELSKKPEVQVEVEVEKPREELITSLDKKLIDLRLELIDLKTRLVPRHPQIYQLEQKIEYLEKEKSALTLQPSQKTDAQIDDKGTAERNTGPTLKDWKVLNYRPNSNHPELYNLDDDRSILFSRIRPCRALPETSIEFEVIVNSGDIDLRIFGVTKDGQRLKASNYLTMGGENWRKKNYDNKGMAVDYSFRIDAKQEELKNIVVEYRIR